MENWLSKMDDRQILISDPCQPYKIDLIPLDPLFQHSSIPSFPCAGSRDSRFSLTWSSFRPVGPTARREGPALTLFSFRLVEPAARREGWSLQIGHQWNNGMVERWNNGDKSGVKSDFILTAVLQILNRYHSTKPNIPVFHYSNTPLV